MLVKKDDTKLTRREMNIIYWMMNDNHKINSKVSSEVLRQK